MRLLEVIGSVRCLKLLLKVRAKPKLCRKAVECRSEGTHRQRPRHARVSSREIRAAIFWQERERRAELV